MTPGGAVVASPSIWGIPMKIVIYSDQTSGFEAGVEYRNPRFFSAPLGKPDVVKVVGDWPAIVAAYEAIGVTVEAVGNATLPTREGIAKMPKSEVIEWLTAHGVEAPDGKVADLRAALTRIMFIEA